MIVTAFRGGTEPGLQAVWHFFFKKRATARLAEPPYLSPKGSHLPIRIFANGEVARRIFAT